MKKLRKPIAFLLAVIMAMMFNFPSGLLSGIGIGLTVYAEDTITFTALDGTKGASGENYDKLVDGNKTSGKWCVTSFSSHSSVYIVFKAAEPIYVDGYTITTGDDNALCRGRNPKDWTLKGCNDYNAETKTGTWVDITTVTNDEVLKDTNYTDYNFSFTPTTTAYQYFKLEITATRGDSCMQMSEFTLSYTTCDHVWSTEKTRTDAPTCTEGGYDVYTCSKCGAEKKVPDGTSTTEHKKGDDGKCTSCSAYMISNATELNAFAAAVKGGEASANAILMADITVNSNLLSSLEYDEESGEVTNGTSFTEWTPIGNSSNKYTGTFDGQGHTISGLYFNDTNSNYVGLFGNVGENGSVSNVGVVDSYFNGKYNVGGVCGYNSGIINGCYAICVADGCENVGGVCGDNGGGVVINCYSTGAVNGEDCVGGVCGYNWGIIANCYSTATVRGSQGVSSVYGQNEAGVVINCYYLSKNGISGAKTAAQFKSGEVAYLLSQGCEKNGKTYNGSIWGQKIGTDDYPILKGDKVYATTGCVTYNNSGDISEKGHQNDKGRCTDCGKYTEPEINESGVYQISKVTELYWLADTVNSGNGSINAVLTADITVNSDLLGSLEYDTDGSVINDDGFKYWTPIGWYDYGSDEKHYYTGTFDGQGHTIIGLYFNDTNSNYVGLFGYVGENGTVSNVGIVDSYFNGKYDVGGVCGYNSGTITNCYSEGTITNCYNEGTVSGSGNVGGVCGYSKGTIINCYSDNSVPGGKVAIGYDNGDSTNVSSKSTAQFASGAVAYLLNGSTSEGSLVWGQTLGGESPDAYPKAHTDTNTVYATTGCVTYNNSGNTDEKEHHNDKGICTDCGKYTEPEKDENGVYQINNVTDLYWFAEYVNSGNGSVNAVLTNDITVNADVLKADGTLADDVSRFTSWTPIGYYNSSNDYNKYTGTFDGQGHTIIGLYFNDTDVSYVGLFGYVGENGTVSNVGIVDSYFSGKKYVGGVCGYNYGKITNCYNEGTVSGSGNYVGGVCGTNEGGKITNCYSTGAVSGSGNDVGGVCGYNDRTIENCYNEGTVSGSGNYVGGVCGYNDRTITNCYNEGTVSGGNDSEDVGGVCGKNHYASTIENCYNEGTVSGSGNVGGVCGTNEGGTITSCYSTGAVSGSGNVGGVCGYNDDTIKNCYNEGTVSGSGNVGGVCGYNDRTIKNCYNEGSVSGSGYSVGGVCGYNYGTITNCYNTGSVSGGEGVGGVCGNNNGSGKITNCYSTGAVEGKRLVGGVCGFNSSNSTITNCYYLAGKASIGIGNADSDSLGKAESKNTEDFTDGTVCGLVDYHSHQNGICILCGSYEPAEQNTDGYYEISSAGQLYWFAGLVNGNSDVCDYDADSNPDVTQKNPSANAVLTNDITVNSDLLGSLGYDNSGSVTNGDGFTAWKPIGYYNGESDCSYYIGTFDGHGHTISGLYFNDTDIDYVGLFGIVGPGGRVSNVGVVDSYFNGHHKVGGVCGDNGGKITNCYNEGTVIGGDSYSVGGVCGENYGEITNCYNEGTVSGGDNNSYIGGVCGDNHGTITNCYYIADSEKDEIDGTTFKTESQFNSGEVAYLLNAGKTDGSQVWYQNIDKGTADISPVLNNTHGIVYQCTNCTAVYSNTQDKYAEHSYIPDTGNDTLHMCKKCGHQELHSNSTLTYSADDTSDTITVICEGCNDNLGTITLSAPNELTYDGNPKKAIVNNEVTGVTIETPAITYKKSDGTVLETAPKDAGTYTASITLGTATVSVKYTIKQATPYIKTKPTATAITYGDTLSASALSGGTVQYSSNDETAVAGTFAWKEATAKPTVADSGKTSYTVVFTPEDSDNYETVETNITLTVNKAENTPNIPKNTINVPYSTEKVSDVTLPTGWVWQDADKTKALTAGEAVTTTAIYNGADKGNYVTEIVEIAITRQACDHTGETEVRDAKVATCTDKGYTGDIYCKDCGEKVKTGTVIPALGHNYTGKVTTEPTTSSEGVRTYTCDRCGHSYTESIPKLPNETHEHSYTDSVTKEPTCTDAGVRTYTCSCGDIYTETIQALGHHYVSSVTKQPTTSSEGVMTYTCDRCGHSYTRTIDKLQDTNNDNPGEENTPDTGKPYIKDETGKEGWDVIKDEVDKTKDGDTVVVEMNGSSVVPGDVLTEIKGKDVTIVFDMGGGITWSVNGKSITGDKTGDIDFSVKVGTNTIPVDIVNNVTGERYSKQISLAYEGEFGFTAVLSINMDKKNAGLFANLFYYNEKTGKLEFICADKIAEDGTAELTFTHASDYAIVIDTEPMDGSGDSTLPGDTDKNDNPPATGDRTPIVWLFILVVLSGTGLVLVGKKGRINLKTLSK